MQKTALQYFDRAMTRCAISDWSPAKARKRR